MPRLVAAIVALLPLAVAAQEQAEDHPPAEPYRALEAPAASKGISFSLGFGYGLASPIDWTGGAHLRLRIGAEAAPSLALGLEGGYLHTARSKLIFYDVGATLHPGGGRFFLRGAVGLTTCSWGSSFTSQAGSETGPNALAGMGVSLGSSPDFMLTLNAEVALHEVAGGSATGTVWLGMEWP